MAYREGEEQGNEAESVICKMAAGRKCRQHDKLLLNYDW
jgi:hypothetical protein